MTKVSNKSKLSVGDIVKHDYRKTLTFIVTETSPKVLISRYDAKTGKANTKFKGYGFAPRDFSQGLITLVSKAAVDNTPNKPISLVVKEDVVTVDQLAKTLNVSDRNIVNEFYRLEADLSPENLSCDGELSAAKTRLRKKDLLWKWNLLEQYVGRKVLAEV